MDGVLCDAVMNGMLCVQAALRGWHDSRAFCCGLKLRWGASLECQSAVAHGVRVYRVTGLQEREAFSQNVRLLAYAHGVGVYTCTFKRQEC
eukprot:1156437-Pelagomonas_calceolata.AAC.4